MAGEALASTRTKSWLYHPVFPEHWEHRPLYSLAEWVNGLAFRDIQFSSTGKPVIKIAEIKGGISNQTKFTEQIFDESVHIGAGDLLFSWSGQPETSIDVFWWRGSDGWLNQHSFRVTPIDCVDPTFFYYILRYLKPSFVGIARNKQTTGLGHVTKRDLGNIEAAYPPMPEQQAIAHILGTLDDKIELNRRMGETLEAIGRALFKSWFVDFDPVRAKAEARSPSLPDSLAELFPADLANSELGQVPEGWQLRSFSEMCETIFSGGTPSTARPDYWGGGIPWLSSGETRSKFIVATEKTITAQGVSHSSTRLARMGATVIASAGQGHTRGQTSMLMFDSYINQSVIALRANSRYSSNAFLFFDLERRYEQFRGMSDGHSSRGSLTTKLLADLRMVMPPPALVEAFDRIAVPLILKIADALRESRNLAALRDTLLPKLISGEVHIRNIERMLEERS